MNEIPVGIDWPDQSERFARLKEAVTLIQQLFREEFVTFEGEFYRTHNATIYDRPDEPVPIYIAASGPAAARLAGRIADGLHLHLAARARSSTRRRCCRRSRRAPRRRAATRDASTG